jgi:biotin synthase
MLIVRAFLFHNLKGEIMRTEEIIQRSLDGLELSKEEITSLFDVDPFSKESFIMQAAALEKSKKASNGLAEVHAQFGLNVGPCTLNCLFCGFAKCNGVFTENSELPVEEAVVRTKRFEEDGVNAIFIMGTGHYPFGKFIEVSREIRKALKDETILFANVGDMNLKQAKQLKEAGHSGIYHVVRMGEGTDTPIAPSRRLETIAHAKEAGLMIGTCVEPIGPEHTVEELVEKTIMTREIGAVFSGAMRRVPIPGTELAKYGMVSEARMAHILAAVRLALGYEIAGHCTHEPGVIAAAAGGANLVWAETGSNPRDTEKDTEGRRGRTVNDCRNILKEAEWDVLEGTSKFCATGIPSRS